MPRLEAIVCVLAGLKTVSEAVRTLGLSRNHFQTILHRAVLSLVESLTIKPGGRPSRSQEVATLRLQLRQLQRENARLQKQVGSTQQLLEVAGGLLQGRIRPMGRGRRTRRNPGASGERRDDNDPDVRQRMLAGVDEMHRLGLTHIAAAAIAGVDASTVRRWRTRERRGDPATVRRICAGRQIASEVASRAEELIRRLRGLIGAQALSHSIEGLSRRAAACIKARTLTAMERERKAALVRVRITQPGVLRGLDAMHFATTEGPLYTLITADGAIPYRTTLITGDHYDAELVARVVGADIEHNGAPLVLRLDHASAHAAPAVHEVLETCQVLVLHGPAHYPCFYGQLERQNREHRAWIGSTHQFSRASVEHCLQEMLECVNALWRRRTLHWKTAAELWNARPRLTIDRNTFREEVSERALRLARTLEGRGQSADLAERLAIERTLERRGYLRQEIGGWC
jgi:hypothetical protein